MKKIDCMLRTALIVVCSVFAITMNGCIPDSRNCIPTEYEYCEDSTLAYFNISNTAKNWLLVDSFSTGNVVFKNQNGASVSFNTTTKKGTNSIISGKHTVDVYDDCVEKFVCPVKVKFDSYEINYAASNYGLNLNLRLQRDSADNLNDTNPESWMEYLSVIQGQNSLNFIPGADHPNYAKNQVIPSITINNILYTNVVHVYDSSLLNIQNLKIMGLYYTPEKGILRYYYNKNNDVWTIQ